MRLTSLDMTTALKTNPAVKALQEKAGDLQQRITDAEKRATALDEEAKRLREQVAALKTERGVIGAAIEVLREHS